MCEVFDSLLIIVYMIGFLSGFLFVELVLFLDIILKKKREAKKNGVTAD